MVDDEKLYGCSIACASSILFIFSHDTEVSICINTLINITFEGTNEGIKYEGKSYLRPKVNTKQNPYSLHSYYQGINNISY